MAMVIHKGMHICQLVRKKSNESRHGLPR